MRYPKYPVKIEMSVFPTIPKNSPIKKTVYVSLAYFSNKKYNLVVAGQKFSDPIYVIAKYPSLNQSMNFS